MTESSSSYCIKIDNNKDRLTYSSAEITTKEKLEEHIKLLDAKIDWASNQVQLIFTTSSATIGQYFKYHSLK